MGTKGVRASFSPRCLSKNLYSRYMNRLSSLMSGAIRATSDLYPRTANPTVYSSWLCPGVDGIPHRPPDVVSFEHFGTGHKSGMEKEISSPGAQHR